MEFERVQHEYITKAMEYHGKKIKQNPVIKGPKRLGKILLAGSALFYAAARYISPETDHYMYSVFPASISAVGFFTSYLNEKISVEVIRSGFQKRSLELSQGDLEKKLQYRDYAKLPMTKEEKDINEINTYASRVVNAVEQKELSWLRFPLPAAGLGLSLYGPYLATQTEKLEEKGYNLIVSAFGMALLLVSGVYKMGKKRYIEELTRQYLKENKNHLDTFIQKKPYEFYLSKIKKK